MTEKEDSTKKPATEPTDDEALEKCVFKDIKLLYYIITLINN